MTYSYSTTVLRDSLYTKLKKQDVISHSYPKGKFSNRIFFKVHSTTYSGQRVCNDTMKTTFLFKFWFLSGFFLNYKFASKQREAVNWTLLFVSMLMFIITVWKVCRNKILKSKVVFNVLIYTTTAVVIVMICCNLKNLSIQCSPDTIEQAISPDLHVVGIPEHTFNNMKNLIIGYF